MKNEIRPLTGVRGIAAFAVMLYHLSHNPQFAPFGYSIFSKGYLCVDLFFVLSGFVMALVYRKEFVGRFSSASYSKFLFNRMARVFPLHLAVTLFFSAKLLINLSGDPRTHLGIVDFVANLFLVEGWGIGAAPIVSNSWSVSTEVFAYLLFPMLITIAFSRWRLVQIAAAIGAIALVALSPLGSRGPLDVVSASSILPMLRCLGGFCLGLAAFYLSQQEFCKRWMSSSVAVAASLAILALLFAIPRGDVFVVLAFPLLIIALSYDSSLASALFGNRVVHHLGVISYSLYLWHPFFRDLAGHQAELAQQHGYAGLYVGFALLAILVSWLWAWLSYVTVEVRGRQVLNWLRKRSQNAEVVFSPQ